MQRSFISQVENYQKATTGPMHLKKQSVSSKVATPLSSYRQQAQGGRPINNGQRQGMDVSDHNNRNVMTEQNYLEDFEDEDDDFLTDFKNKGNNNGLNFIPELERTYQDLNTSNLSLGTRKKIGARVATARSNVQAASTQQQQMYSNGKKD